VSQVDWDRLQYYSRKVKFFMAINTNNPQPEPEVHPSTYLRIAQLLSSASTLFPSLRHLEYDLDDRSISHIFLFLSPFLESLKLDSSDFIGDFGNTILGSFLATLSPQMLSRIVIRFARMPVGILKTSIVHFKRLRSLELYDAVFMSDFVLWEVLGTLPSLADLNLTILPPCPMHDSENSNGVPKYFYTPSLENLCVEGSFFLIQHLLSSIDSPCLESIKVYPVDDYSDTGQESDSIAPSLKIIASMWSRSLKTLVIGKWSSDGPGVHRNTISRCLNLLMVLHEMETFEIRDWRMQNVENTMDDDVRCLVMSWPKLRTLKLELPLNETFISMSTLKIIAENCPELRHLKIQLDTSTIPPFDTSKSLRHKLEVLTVERAHPDSPRQTMLEHRIQVTQYLDFIFPYLKSIEIMMNPVDETWSAIHNLVKLCQDARQRK
jgi:hypothetical protein